MQRPVTGLHDGADRFVTSNLRYVYTDPQEADAYERHPRYDLQQCLFQRSALARFQRRFVVTVEWQLMNVPHTDKEVTPRLKALLDKNDFMFVRIQAPATEIEK